MRTRVIGDGGDNRFLSNVSVNETFVGRGGDDFYISGSLDERDRLIGGPGDDEFAIGFFEYGPGAGIAAMNRAIWFDGGAGYDRIVYSVIYPSESRDIDLGAFGGTLNSVEAYTYRLVDSPGVAAPGGLADYAVSGTGRGEDIQLMFGRGGYDRLTTTVDAGGGNDTVSVSGSIYDRLVIDGGAGSDIIAVGSMREDGEDQHLVIRGGSGNDQIFYGGSGGKVFGGAGRDTLLMSAQDWRDEGPPTIYRGGKGADTFVFWSNQLIPDVGGRIKGFGARDKFVIIDRITASVDNISLTPTDPPSYIEYDPATGYLSVGQRDVFQFDPGTVISPDQVSIASAADFDDFFFLGSLPFF